MHEFRSEHRGCCAPGPSDPSSAFKLAGTPHVYERSLPFPITELGLDLKIDLEARSLSGTAIVHFKRHAVRATTLTLDAVGFELKSVELASGDRFAPVHYDYDGKEIEIELGSRITKGRIRIQYAAKPQRGLYFLKPDQKVKNRPVQVWSQCQDEDARHWFPCHDKPHAKMKLDLKVEVPAGFTAISNGEAVPAPRKRTGKDPARFHFRLDELLSSYLVTLVVGRFDRISDRPAQLEDGRSIPIDYYVPKGRSSDAQRSLGETPKMVELFSRLTGVSYPWSRYSQVVVSDFIFGGMENTTCTTLYEHVLLDERAALDVTSCDLVAHELAHQWFGDLVTCRDWSHAWLNEGFATFFEHVEREHRLGVDEYEAGVAGDISSYLAEADGRYQRPIVCREYLEPIDLFDRHLYEKGGLVLHMLRRQLGDDVFWAGVREYIGRHRHGVVETNDLKRALEHSSGLSLERFFDQWVYRPGHPVLKLSASHERGLLSVTARQTQKTGEVSTFAFPFEVEVLHHDGKLRRYAKDATANHETLVIHCKERPRYVAFDPDFKLVGQFSLEMPNDMLRHQLKKGSSARLRSIAAEALGKHTDFVTVKALAASLLDDKEAWMVRVEAARALSQIGGTDTADFLVKALSVRAPKVRRAVVTALGKYRDATVARALTAPAKRDPSYLVEAEAARALGKTRQAGALATLLGELDKPSWADVKMSGVIEGLAALRDDAPLDKLVERTEYGVPTRARRAAIRVLPTLSETPKIRQHIEDLLDDWDPHVRADVVSALGNLGNPRSRGPLRRRLAKENDGRVSRQIHEALRDMGSSASSEQRRQADELETLRREVSDLKTRISKLEPSKAAKKSRK